MDQYNLCAWYLNSHGLAEYSHWCHLSLLLSESIIAALGLPS